MIRSFPTRLAAATAFGFATLLSVVGGAGAAEDEKPVRIVSAQPTVEVASAGLQTKPGVPSTPTPVVSRSSLPTCFGQVATISGVLNAYGQTVFQGTNGNDVIVGTAGQDVIKGEGGDDLICALGDADVVHAGDGNDTVDAGDGRDSVNGLNGNDVVYGRGGDDLLSGDAGHDLVSGGDGNDALGGWDGDDVLLGEAGDDSLEGMAGFDQLDGGLGTNDFCHGGSTVGGAENDAAANCETAVAIP
jgi:Ca2+-binding RTX toxin-like protein